MESKNKTYVTGALRKVICHIENGAARFCGYLSFKDGIARIEFDDANEFLALIKQYNIAIPNANLNFVCIDFDRNFEFAIDAFNDEENYLDTLISIIPEFKPFGSIVSNVDIVNYGITFDMKCMVCNEECPEELRKSFFADANEIDIKDEPLYYRQDGEFWHINPTFPNFTPCFMAVSNDYGNECWNGPSSFGGYLGTTGVGYSSDAITPKKEGGRL